MNRDSRHPVWMAALEELMVEHRRMPFPSSVEKGLDYGEVDAVMIGADIHGWALAAASGMLSSEQLVRLQEAREALSRSVTAFPRDARPYYQQLVELALEAERRGHA